MGIVEFEKAEYTRRYNDLTDKYHLEEVRVFVRDRNGKIESIVLDDALVEMFEKIVCPNRVAKDGKYGVDNVVICTFKAEDEEYSKPAFNAVIFLNRHC